MAEKCTRCGGTQNDPEDSRPGSYGGWYNEPPTSAPCRECVVRSGVLDQIRRRIKGPAGATLLDIETLLSMVDELRVERDAALDPFNWAAVFTGDEATLDAATTAMTHGNLLTIDGTGQVLFHYAPSAQEGAAP